MTRPTHRDEEGSLLLALIAVVAIGAMSVATFSMVRQSQRTTQRDRSFTSSIQVADTGVQQALTYLSTTVVPPATTTVNSADLGLPTTTDGGAFQWTATRNGFSWNVRATGTVGGVERRIEAVIERPSRFFLAAFGDQFITLRGGNIADSYSSATCGAVAVCPKTGNGAVGSNGAITLNGNADVDAVFLYGPDASCSGAECTDPSTLGGGASAPIDVTELSDVMAAEALAACPTGPTDGLYRSSTFGPLTGGNTYCFSGMIFDTTTTTLTSATQASPVTTFVFSDGILGDKVGQSVNMPATGPPMPAHFVINVLAGDVLLRNQSDYAFAVLAPLSLCGPNNSNAQTDIYGSLICASLGNVGGWEFHFDDALLGSGIGTFDITAWREEVGSSTSF